MAQRKLQAEIDRTLKTVAQGVEVFENTFEKLGNSTNLTQKDKLETDLKTQIKKLQRSRDTIKAWIGSSDIKDKSALTEGRKSIEAQMERFKALEKEMKMKAYSKEGLSASQKLDPAEKAKRDVIDWIGTTVDELSRQIEQTEAEMEAVQGGSKKKKAMGEKLSELEELNERRVWHNSKLEIVQRMLENGQLSVDQVEVIQEDIKYFVEANAEEDFDYDDGIYEDLNLQEEDEYLQDLAQHDELSNLDSSSVIDMTEVSPPSTPAPAPAVAKTPAKEEKKDKPTSAIKTSTPGGPPFNDEPPSPIMAKKQPSRKSTMESTKAEPMIKSIKPATPSAEVPAPVPSVPKAALPPIRYAAAVAGPATAAATAAAAATGTPATVTPTAEIVSSPTVVKTELPDPTPAPSAPPSQEKEASAPSGVTSSPPVDSTPRQDSASNTNGHQTAPPPGLSAPSPAPTNTNAYQNVSSPFGAPQASPSPANVGGPGATPQSYNQQQRGESSRAGAQSATSPRMPHGVMGNLMHSFDVAKEISERRAGDLNELHNALDSSYSNAPSQQDAEPPRYYHPTNPIKTPSYYPQTRPQSLLRREKLSELEMDQLFYIFYYRTGTYEQWCVAEELKSQSWRFHKQYLTWFQRAHNPQAITEDYEQGGYLYFDWENSWCQRKKSDFRFEYRWLSDH